MELQASCLAFCIISVFSLSVSAADPLIEVSPFEITPGMTSPLDINCTFTFNKPSVMASFFSLVLSRTDATGQNFQDLAAVSEFSPDNVILLAREEVSAAGVYSQTGESSLRLTWENPAALQAGVYQCSALGVNVIGRSVALTYTSLVTLEEAKVNDVLEKMREMEEHEASMEQYIEALEKDRVSMGQRIQHLENKTQSLNHDKVFMQEHISFLEYRVFRFESTMEVMQAVDLLGRRNGESYYVSGHGFGDVNKSMDVCRTLGGQLAIIDDQDEFDAILGFLNAASGFDYVVVAGTDVVTEGNWMSQESETPLPFTSWAEGFPLTNMTRNCLMLDSFKSWFMIDSYCHSDSPSDNTRFMCEV